MPGRGFNKIGLDMKIGFINPSSDYLFDPFRGDPHTQYQLLTVLSERFPSWEFVLIDLRGVKSEFATRHVPECDLYLYSDYTLDHGELTGLCAQLKERFPQARHVVGGPHAMIYPEECLGHFDSVVVGEGEEVVCEAVGDAGNGGLKPVYRQAEAVDLDEYPCPSREFLPEATVARKGLLALKTTRKYDDVLGTTALFSRGCPFRCAFCSMPSRRTFSLGIRYRSPALVKTEIEYLKARYGVSGLNLFDEIVLPLRIDKALAHLEAIGSTDIIWRGQNRVDGLTDELAVLARQAGCVQISVGIESVWQPTLDIINKRIDIGQARRAIEILKRAGIECRVYLISGLPAEPPDIVERTIEFLEEARPDTVVVSLATVRPGTDMFDRPERYGIEEVRTEWDGTMHLYNRYELERPERLSFRYAKEGPWGPQPNEERIIDNFMKLQGEIDARGMGRS